MNNRAGLRAVIMTALLASGCATPPKTPSPEVTALLSEMSETQAAEEIHRLLQPRNFYGNTTRTFITGHIGLGLCKASQISLNQQKGPELRVTTQEISFNAVRSGSPVTDARAERVASGTAMTAADHRDLLHYRDHLRFDRIEAVVVTEPRLLRTLCGRQKDQSEAVIRESATHWYAALIPTEEKDRFIAAVMKLRPDVAITTEIEEE